MSRKIRLSALFLIIVLPVFAQYECEDALRLSSFIGVTGTFSPDHSAAVDTILARYLSLFSGKPVEAYRNNDFIKGYINWDEDMTLRSGLPGGVSALAGAAGGLDVTNLADGLAKFLVKRTKEELSVAFFSKFRETLDSSRYADLRVLFPATWQLLRVIGDEIYDYNRYIGNLREAFRTDLLTLDEHLPGIIGNHEKFFVQHFGMAAGLNTACFITRSLKEQMHPGDILDNYPLEYLIRPGDTAYFDRNWSGAIQTMQIFSHSLRSEDVAGTGYWVRMDKINRMLRNRDAMKIYLGLVYQSAQMDRYRNVPFGKGSLSEAMKKIDFDRDYAAYRNFITGFALKAKELGDILQHGPAGKTDSAAIELYAQYVRATVGMIEYCTRISTLPHVDALVGTDLHAKLEGYFTITYGTTDLATSLVRKNYPAAVNHLLAIYRLVRTGPLKEQSDALDRMSAAPATGAKPGFFGPGDKAVVRDSLKISEDVLAKLARYGAFISSVATAKSSDEVSQAIEAAALPCGSSRIKRESSWNVSLNAYTGLFAGYERIDGFDEGGAKLNTFGVAAPVGVAVSTGSHSFLFLWPKHEGHWSYSLFASLIDIGALAAFRFQESETVAQVPRVQLRDIVSPGLFLSVGFPRVPLSLNFGAQVGPNLREVNVLQADGSRINKYSNNTSWRYSASLVVDIPLFNFYTKTKR
ncbi:MAG TPA: hypothetical protein PLK82_09415 [Bacteroidales bacterium]|nr:hypothetical protein [Bacteroidales bacterium]